MGHNKIVAEKSLFFGKNIDGALGWIEKNKDEADF